MYREALGSTPYFANFATPLLIEKVMTATGSAKVTPALLL